MRAKKSLGQNFLRDASVVRGIVDALQLTPDDIVIEIGPGRGALTAELVARAANVVAVEFDRDMVGLLRGRFGDKVQIVEADVLNVDLRGFGGTKVVGNLPYNISTPILQRLIDTGDSFSALVLMFQREVVERITAPPGSADRGYLTVLVEAAFTVERLFDVPPEAFSPRPKVWSAVARFTPKQSPSAADTAFRRLVSVAFAQKRKTIFNNLKTELPNAAAALEAAGIDSRRRAETLTLEEWFGLAGVIRAKKPGV
jgi:16S rRNA (adenine1518-N6/adenine1519-N6)-dimethyltransferase